MSNGLLSKVLGVSEGSDEDIFGGDVEVDDGAGLEARESQTVADDLEVVTG